jgi:hypothetical protein
MDFGLHPQRGDWESEGRWNARSRRSLISGQFLHPVLTSHNTAPPVTCFEWSRAQNSSLLKCWIRLSFRMLRHSRLAHFVHNTRNLPLKKWVNSAKMVEMRMRHQTFQESPVLLYEPLWSVAAGPLSSRVNPLKSLTIVTDTICSERQPCPPHASFVRMI